MTTTTDFQIAGGIIRVPFDRQILAREPAGSIRAVTVTPEHPILIGGKQYPFAAFAVRVTPQFDVVQAGDGIPCEDEKTAEGYAQLFGGKPLKVPHVGLMSVPGFFTMATVTHIDFVKPRLDLIRLPAPKMVKGQPCGFVLRYQNHHSDKPPELAWEEFLPTTNLKAARNMMRKKQAEMTAKADAARTAFEKIAPVAKGEPDLTPMQLEVLAKAYPDTVAFLKNPEPGERRCPFCSLSARDVRSKTMQGRHIARRRGFESVRPGHRGST